MKYQWTFRATLPTGEIRKTSAVFAQDYDEAVAKAEGRARVFLRESELDWDVDVVCPLEECRDQ